jgi:Fur family peroxide stress response transcriptional regulator
MKPAELARQVERFQDACRAAGVKLTHQRLEIFREVVTSHEHPDADAVYRAVRQRMPTVSLDTVYRTLALLHELGFLSTLGSHRESVRYDANLTPHHHFVCVRCGMARDFVEPDLESLGVPAAVREFGTVAEMHLEVRGLCAACAKKAE